MRITLVALNIIALASAAVSAEPVRTVCYTGAQAAKIGTSEQTTHAVVERTYDPANSEIRQRTWSDKNPTHELAMTAKVDPKAGVFEFDDPALGAHGTGKLEGKPWHWTAMTMTVAKGDISVASTSKLTETSLHQEAVMTKNSKQIGTVIGDLTTFDCKLLDTKKAELAKPSAQAPTTPAK